MLTLNFNPFHDLETERLLLRRLNVNDAEEILLLRGNPETMKYIPRPLAKTREDALQHIEMIDSKIDANEGINWAITLKGSPKVIGIIGHYMIQHHNHRAEIGYMILPEFQGKGIITEAVKEVIDYGFNVMKLHSIEAVIDPENVASEAVLKKFGFVKEAHFKENGYHDGKFIDSVVYSLLNK